MGNVINLRQARKQRTRVEKREIADARTAISGIKTHDRTLANSLKEISDRTLDGHKRDDEAE